MRAVVIRSERKQILRTLRVLRMTSVVILSAAKDLLLPLLTLLPLLAACSGGVDALFRRGRAEQLFDARDLHAAYGAFTSLAQATSSRRPEALAILEYNSGDAAYRLGKFQDAIRHFHAALAGPPVLQQHAQYNLGNSYIWLARAESDKRSSLRAAVNAFEEAVLLDPRDSDAKWNLELALIHLADEETRLGGGTRREANWGGGNLTKSGYAGTPQTGAGATPGGGFGAGGGDEVVPEITESDARQMLREAERAQVTGQDVRKMSGARRAARKRDW